MKLCIVESCILKSTYDCLTQKHKNYFNKIYYSFQNKESTSIYDTINDSNSLIYKEKFDVYIIGIGDTLRQEFFTNISSGINNFTKNEYNEILESNIKKIIKSIDVLNSLYEGINIILNIYPINVFNNKLFSYKYNENCIKFYSKYLYLMYEIPENYKNVYILDSNVISNTKGIYNLKSPSHRFSGKFGEIYGSHLNSSIGPEMAKLIISIINGIYKKQEIKAVIVDLDNTMWDGVLLESNKKSVKLNLFRANVLYQLHRQGIILCVCSKNNNDDETLQKIKILLGSISKYILIYKVNWEPKSHNIKDIINKLNIGANSIAFFDDQEFERNEVKQNCPEINIFTDDDIDTILINGRFNSIIISEESQSRNNQYLLNFKRNDEEKNIQNSHEDYISYIKSLNFKLTSSFFDEKKLNRVYELISRTNQQNFTLKRFTIEEIEKFSKEKNNEILIYSLSDKFGSYGTICSILLTHEKDECVIKEFALSCRAMGKKIEHSILVSLNNYLFSKGVNILKTLVVENNKNDKIIEELLFLGFRKGNNNIYKFNMTKKLDFPDWISFQTEK